jgi:cyclopropane fatty-acyl-phospholipid synthase-like methyltransferase
LIRKLLFEMRYLLGDTPWDTEISPPELLSFLENHPADRALDLGCGTGTNTLTMGNYGWEVIGVDVSQLAIRRAQAKVAEQHGRVSFQRLDVSRLKGIGGQFKLILDIGCFHSLSSKAQARYIQRIATLIHPQGTYLLYTWLADPEQPRSHLLNAGQVKQAFAPYFDKITHQVGTERGRPTAWFKIQVNAI